MRGRPKEKQLRLLPFATHVTRGILRDSRIRRRTMLAVLGLAVLLVLLGSTILRDALNPREHAAWFILFWAACAWFTLTAILLAILDLLLVRREARAARRAEEKTLHSGSGRH